MLLGIYTEETRTEIVTCTPMSITALFIIARTWKQPRCPSADEWTRKLCYIYTMEFRNMVMIILYARQKKRHRCIEQTYGLCGRRRGWDDLGE